jgi:hypothetical protein
MLRKFSEVTGSLYASIDFVVRNSQRVCKVTMVRSDGHGNSKAHIRYYRDIYEATKALFNSYVSTTGCTLNGIHRDNSWFMERLALLKPRQ